MSRIMFSDNKSKRELMRIVKDQQGRIASQLQTIAYIMRAVFMFKIEIPLVKLGELNPGAIKVETDGISLTITIPDDLKNKLMAKPEPMAEKKNNIADLEAAVEKFDNKLRAMGIPDGPIDLEHTETGLRIKKGVDDEKPNAGKNNPESRGEIGGRSEPEKANEAPAPGPGDTPPNDGTRGV